MSRKDGRAENVLRDIRFDISWNPFIPASVLLHWGKTRVLCTVTEEARRPSFLQGSDEGWVRAEYGLLPGSSPGRNAREAALGRQSGRTQEIQRLMGRSLRSMVDRNALGPMTMVSDCDVLVADGGTRCASITASSLAIVLLLNTYHKKKIFSSFPLHGIVSAVSVGICEGRPVLDLDYSEDSKAGVDMNIVMLNGEKFVEVQGSAEGSVFTQDELSTMLELGKKGCQAIFEMQKECLDSHGVNLDAVFGK